MYTHYGLNENYHPEVNAVECLIQSWWNCLGRKVMDTLGSTASLGKVYPWVGGRIGFESV